MEMIVIIYSDQDANPDEIPGNEYEEEKKINKENVEDPMNYNDEEQQNPNNEGNPDNEKEVKDENINDMNIENEYDGQSKEKENKKNANKIENDTFYNDPTKYKFTSKDFFGQSSTIFNSFEAAISYCESTYQTLIENKIREFQDPDFGPQSNDPEDEGNGKSLVWNGNIENKCIF